MSKAINAVKDFAIKAADWVEDHPWLALGTIAGLVVLAFVGLLS